MWIILLKYIKRQQEMHCKYKGKRTEKTYHADTGQRKVGAVILISIKVKSEQKLLPDLENFVS